MEVVRKVDDWIFSAKSHSTSVSPDRQTVYSFDLEGRPLFWYEGDRVYKRSLASDVYGRKHAGGEKRYWIVPPEEARDLFARTLARLVPAARRQIDDATLRRRLDEIQGWTPDTLLAERERFDSTYEPVSILPPDQYLSVVLQATFGCTWNRCTFCSFYQDRPFRTRTAERFREHCSQVADLLGRAVALRKQIFLADGNALVLANEKLLPLFEIARDAFPDRAINGFVDVFTGERKSAADWADLRAAGLGRVYVGVESGDDALLAWLNKPGGAEEAAAFVTTLKAAGLRVSVILMVGAGGERFARSHIERTLELLSRLPLGAGDIVYLSPFQEKAGSAYARRAMEEGVRELDPATLDAQYAALRDGARRALPGAVVTRYDIREFVY